MMFLLNFVSCSHLNDNTNNVKKDSISKTNKIYFATPKPLPTAKPKLIQSNKSPIVVPSTIIDDLKNKLKEDNISNENLVEYANDLLKKKGYNFIFSWEPKGKENLKTLNAVDGKNLFPFGYTFKNLKNKNSKIYFANTDFEHPCFSTIEIPITKVSDKIMTVILDDKPTELTRTKDFYLEEFVLVDKSLKKKIRKWFVSIDSNPLGISKDGRKIYMEYNFAQNEYEQTLQIENLVIEISEDGVLQFVSRDDSKILKGEELKGFPKTGEKSYKLFTNGDKEYIVKFSYPCT